MINCLQPPRSIDWVASRPRRSDGTLCAMLLQDSSSRYPAIKRAEGTCLSAGFDGGGSFSLMMTDSQDRS